LEQTALTAQPGVPQVPEVPTVETAGETPIISRNTPMFREAIGSNQETIPSWNNAGRPAKAKPGTFGYNIQTHNLEYWNGSTWLILPTKKV
jgi:hypothetical protein